MKKNIKITLIGSGIAVLLIVISGFVKFNYFDEPLLEGGKPIPPKELVMANMASTDFSAHIVLIDCEISFRDLMYTTVVCNAEVKEVYDSNEDPAPTSIVYKKTMETNSFPDSVEKLGSSEWLISVNKIEGELGAYYVAPDVAYEFFYSPELAQIFTDESLP